MVNTNKIKGRMRELEITQADVAKELKIAQPTANQKINNIRPFNKKLNSLRICFILLLVSLEFIFLLDLLYYATRKN